MPVFLALRSKDVQSVCKPFKPKKPEMKMKVEAIPQTAEAMEQTAERIPQGSHSAHNVIKNIINAAKYICIAKAQTGLNSDIIEIYGQRLMDIEIKIMKLKHDQKEIISKIMPKQDEKLFIED